MKQIKTIAANSGTTLFCWIVFEGLYFVLFGLSSAVEWFAASDNKFVYVLGTAVCILPVFLLYLLFYQLGRKYLNYTNSFWLDFIPILVVFALAQLLLTALTVDFFPFPPMEMLLSMRNLNLRTAWTATSITRRPIAARNCVPIMAATTVSGTTFA